MYCLDLWFVSNLKPLIRIWLILFFSISFNFLRNPNWDVEEVKGFDLLIFFSLFFSSYFSIFIFTTYLQLCAYVVVIIIVLATIPSIWGSYVFMYAYDFMYVIVFVNLFIFVTSLWSRRLGYWGIKDFNLLLFASSPFDFFLLTK